jgi:peptidoglycan/LPS O-acetylase OafA/YrhL
VISGFIMVVTTSDGKAGPTDFLAKRIARIVPIYWIVTLVLVAITLTGQKPVGIMRMQADWVVKSLLFIPFDRDGHVEPVNSVGWTLNYEMFFYVIFTACLFVKESSTRVLLLCSTMVALTVLGLFSDLGLFGKFYTTPIILEFAFGSALGYLFQLVGRREQKADPGGRLVSCLLIAAGIAVIAAAQVTTICWDIRTELAGLTRPVVWGVGGLFIVAGAIFLERSGCIISSGWPKKLGDASYSIYLIHGLLLHASSKIAGAFLPMGIPYLLVTAVLGVTLSTGLGLALFRTIEAPTSQWARLRLLAVADRHAVVREGQP